MSRVEPIRVGEITLIEAARFVTYYEVAAWRSVVEVAPGTYPVLAHPYTSVPGRYWQPKLDAPGICVEDYKPSLFGGVRIPNTKSDLDTGKPMSPRGLPYELRESVILDPGFEWTAMSEIQRTRESDT